MAPRRLQATREVREPQGGYRQPSTAKPLYACAGDVILLDTTKELIHSALLSPTASGALTNGDALDRQADDEFSDEVSAAIVDWIAQRMSDYHKNFHDTQLMQVSACPH